LAGIAERILPAQAERRTSQSTPPIRLRVNQQIDRSHYPTDAQSRSGLCAIARARPPSVTRTWLGAMRRWSTSSSSIRAATTSPTAALRGVAGVAQPHPATPTPAHLRPGPDRAGYDAPSVVGDLQGHANDRMNSALIFAPARWAAPGEAWWTGGGGFAC
jgi:hypothetical protein